MPFPVYRSEIVSYDVLVEGWKISNYHIISLFVFLLFVLFFSWDHPEEQHVIDVISTAGSQQVPPPYYEDAEEHVGEMSLDPVVGRALLAHHGLEHGPAVHLETV